MKYSKPALIEIFSEIYLEENSLNQSQVFDIVPLLKKLKLQEIEIVPLPVMLPLNANQIPIELISPNLQRVRCWSHNKDKLVQLSNDFIVVNQVGEYLGWHNFLELFKETISLIDNELVNIQIKSITLNTMDRMIIPTEDYTFGKYINCNGTIVPKWFEKTSCNVDITLGKGIVDQDGMNRQIGITVRGLPSNVEKEIFIRSVFHEGIKTRNELLDVLEKLHIESSASFEQLITNATRKLMN